MEPKTLFAMIAEMQDIEDYRAVIQAVASSGGELPKRIKAHAKKEAQDFYVHPDCF